MKLLLFFLLLGIAVFTEAVFWQMPITLCLLLIFFIHAKGNGVFFFAFIAGVVLDILHVDPVGLRSIFFLLFLLIIFLYERKFEVNTLPFVFGASVIGSFLYFLLFSYRVFFLLPFASGILGIVFFFIASFFEKKSPSADFAVLH